ncbi:MAG: hypothetical protein AB1486_23330 [Planctomycetota bacterium]
MAGKTARNLLLLTSLAVLPASFTPGQEPVPQGDSFLVQLSAVDELAAALSFDTGGHGATVQDGQLILDNAHMVYNLFAEHKLTLGFVRKQLVRVVELDDLKVEGFARPEDFAPRLPLSFFHTLTIEGKQVVYRGPMNRTYRLKEAEKIFQTLPPEGLVHIDPQIGRTYLVRFAPRDAQNSQDAFVKFRVVDIEPGRFITLRFARITP